jgi:hypothetical protein
MRLSMPCDQCLQELPPETWPPVEQRPALVGEVLDGGVVHSRCEKGHAVTFFLNEPAFELMFEFAALALLDGYYREAVLGFTTAIERLYAFVAKFIAARRGLPTDVFGEAWRKINRAERQLGAFLALYALEMKRPCDLAAIDRFTELRNRVAHEGVIPMREQALKYGTAALDMIHRTLRELFGSDVFEGEKRGIGLAFKIAAEERRSQVAPPQGARVAHLVRFETIVALKVPSAWGEGVFPERLEHLRVHRPRFYAVEPGADDAMGDEGRS